MYICVCKAVTDGQIRDAIDKGLCSRRQLVQCFGVGRDCGRCNQCVGQLLAGAGTEAEDRPPLPSHQESRLQEAATR